MIKAKGSRVPLLEGWGDATNVGGYKYNNSSGEGVMGLGLCHRQAPSVQFSGLISRAVTAILNPMGHTVCL